MNHADRALIIVCALLLAISASMLLGIYAKLN